MWKGAVGSDFTSPTVPTLVDDGGFNFFTIRKIHDAVSQIFNEKAGTLNQYSSTLNLLSTTFNPATGAVGASNPGTLKVNMRNSWVQFKIKNLSGRVVNLVIWELTPKLKFQNTNPLEALNSVSQGAGGIAVDSITEDFTIRYADSAGYARPGFMIDNNIDPCKMLQSLGFNFEMVKRDMVLAPDETCVHSIKGPSGEIDFGKMMVDNVQQTKLLKGFSVSCIFGVHADQVLNPTSTSNAQRFVSNGTVTAGLNTYNLSLPIAVEYEESMSFDVPEIAGFMTRTAVAGNPQPLNFRKRKIVYQNWVDANGNARGNYQVSNEVNPAADQGVVGTFI